jgi:hypothetical protein
MSASRHIHDAEIEAKRLTIDLGALIESVRSGHALDLDDLEHCRRACIAVLYHASRAGYDLDRMPEQERRLA